MNKKSKIFVAGHKGLVGSALLRKLNKDGYKNIITKERRYLNLINQSACEEFFRKEKPEFVFLAAAKVGGILANNNYRGEFIYDNLMIETNVIHQSYLHHREVADVSRPLRADQHCGVSSNRLLRPASASRLSRCPYRPVPSDQAFHCL